MTKYFLSGFFILISLITFSQEKNDNQTTDTSATRKNSINIFVDCNYCDLERFKSEITFVNFVRDRKLSDVQIIITEMTTGSGGVEYTFAFYGRNKFEGYDDTLRFSLPPNSTADEERTAQINMIKLGLVSYIAKTPMGKKITVVYNEQDEEKKDEFVEDKWKSWVFSFNISGYMSGEEIYSSYNLWSNISISKITPDIKFELDFSNNYSENQYRFNENTLTTISRSNYTSVLLAKSYGEHWSVGGFVNVFSSSYRNLNISTSIAPAVEYNFFKYSDATSKQLRLLYRIGYTYNDYIDTTIFNKVEESLPFHKLSLNFRYVKKWGSLESTITYRSYLDDIEKYSMGIHLGGRVRVFKGLSVRLWGSANQNRDQIELRKGDTSAEDILLKQKQMASQYNFWTNFGLSYTFGSMYNNVVNPRFD